MSSTVVARVLRAMRNDEAAVDGGDAGHGSLLSTGREPAAQPKREPVVVGASTDLQARLAALEQRLDAAFELIRALQRERDELRKENAALAAALAEHGAAAERVAAAEQALAEQTARREELEVEVGRLHELKNVEAEAVEPTGAAEPEATAHLVFVSCADGYRLLECAGPPPAVGSVVELRGETGLDGRHLVVRVGEASLPGPPTRCAYLLPVD
jgi:FtsZ-binding cell division protein ZapB